MIHDCPKCEEINKGKWVDDWDVCPECLIALQVDLGPLSLKYLDDLDSQDEEW